MRPKLGWGNCALKGCAIPKDVLRVVWLCCKGRCLDFYCAARKQIQDSQGLGRLRWLDKAEDGAEAEVALALIPPLNWDIHHITTTNHQDKSTNLSTLKALKEPEDLSS